jgi:predicted acylesterase/phospholipase RssA
VCTAAKDLYGITRLRSYDLPRKPAIPATICEAALATSAATGFFDPVRIGARHFVDGALGANNPVDEVEGEASEIWCSDSGDLKQLVKCLISIGTGNPGKKAIEDSLPSFLSKTLVSITTGTEETAKKFIARWRRHYDQNRYFRLNVEQGLQDVGLAEYKERGSIETATDSYLDDQAQAFRVRDCVKNLKLKQSVYIEDFA